MLLMKTTYDDLVGVVTRSCDKDGGHTIGSAMAETPLLYANFTAVFSTSEVIAD